MMHKHFLVFATLSFVFIGAAQADDPSPAAKPAVENAAEKGADSKTDNDASAEENKPSLKEVRAAVDSKEFAKAADLLADALAGNPDDAKLQSVRTTLAISFLRQRKYDEAYEQTKESLDFYLRNLDEPDHQRNMASVCSRLRLCGQRARKTGEANELIGEAFEALDKITADHPAARVKGLTYMVSLKANMLSLQNKAKEARTLVTDFLGDVDKVDPSNLDELSAEDYSLAKSRLHYANAMIPGAGTEERETFDNFLNQMVSDHPDSTRVMQDYLRGQVAVISRTYRNEPTEAMKRIESVRDLVDKSDASDVATRSSLRSLDSIERSIESALLREKMIGQAAPEIDPGAWVNQGEVTLDSLKGKVVLLDFWSVWCGPCIASFPHLRDWHDEFGDDGLQIVGVTRYYNYTWDEDAERATRVAGKDVSPEEERSMLKSFLAKHELKHPTIITPEGSSMQSDYGVTGIPHAVLIDREGIVQLVKVGSGRANAEAIKAKIEELMKQ